MDLKSQFLVLVKAAKGAVSGSNEVEEAFAIISKSIDDGNVPSKEELDIFFDVETVSRKAKGDFAKYGKEIVKKVVEKVGNNAEVINDLNLVLHATYFQDVESVEKLLKVQDVNANISPQYAAGAIRGATPINMASSLIGDKESDTIFDLLADRLIKQRSAESTVNVGDWIAWGMGGTSDIGATYNRMEKYSEYFEISDAELMKLMAGITAGQFPQSTQMQSFTDGLMKRVSLKEGELSKYAGALNTNVALLVTNIDDNTPQYKLKFALQCATLSTEKLDLVTNGLPEKGLKVYKRLEALQDKILQMPEQQKEACRNFVVNPKGNYLEKLPEIFADNDKFDKFVKSMADNKSLYAEFKKEIGKDDFLKPFLDVVDDEVRKSKGVFKRLAASLAIGKGGEAGRKDLDDIFADKELKKEDYVSLEELQDKSREFLGKLVEKGMLASSDLENIPDRFDALENFVKAKYQQAVNSWYAKQISNFSGGDEVAEGFAKKNERLATEVMDYSLDKLLENHQDRLIDELGTRSLELKRERSQSALRSSDEAPTKHR